MFITKRNKLNILLTIIDIASLFFNFVFAYTSKFGFIALTLLIYSFGLPICGMVIVAFSIANYLKLKEEQNDVNIKIFILDICCLIIQIAIWVLIVVVLGAGV